VRIFLHVPVTDTKSETAIKRLRSANIPATAGALIAQGSAPTSGVIVLSRT
jgi:hypothetical protein